MKSMIFPASLAAMCVWVGCAGRLDGASASPDLLAGYHFAGGDRLASEPNATKLQEIIRLPQTQALGRHILERLALAPRALFPATIDEAQADGGIPLLRPLLEDWVRRESFLEVHGRIDSAPGWLFGIALPAERGAMWRRNLAELMTLWRIGTAVTGDQDGVSLTTVKDEAGLTVVRWGQAGEWLLLGVGAESFGTWDQAVASVRQSRRPVPALTNEWLTAELDLVRLAPSLGLPSRSIWPHATVSATSRDEDVRLTARLVFAESVTGPLDPWRVPTNIIQEPLISFTAWRGARPLLSQWELLPRLGLSPAPNEVFAWAQALNVPQTLLAFPANDPTNRVRAMREPIMELIPDTWRNRGLGQIEWREGDHQLVWKGLPLLFPHLRGDEAGGRGFITGGSFPALQTTNPPPGELLGQFVGKPDLIYYDWEITARRLGQLRMQMQLSTMLTRKSLLRTNTPALPWLEEMEQRLGNSATEVLAVSPHEWALTRKSPVGLTATELMGLLCWVESLDFPRFSFRFPDQIKSRTVPAPKRNR
jgi:hypothetical protein